MSSQSFPRKALRRRARARARTAGTAATIAIALLAGIGGASCGKRGSGQAAGSSAQSASASIVASSGNAPPSVASAAAPVCSALAQVPLPEIAHEPIDLAVPAIVDPTTSLAAFYEKFAALLRGERKSPIRIAMYGDSNLTADSISGELRRKLQGPHGDAGHGWVALGTPWGDGYVSWYVHEDLKQYDRPDDWVTYAVSTKPVRDRRIGHAGIAAESNYSGAMNWFETAPPKSVVGKTVSHVEVLYLRRPQSPALRIEISPPGTSNDAQVTEVPTVGELGAASATLDVEDAPHRVRVVARGSGLRVYGIVFERLVPGFVVDSLGVLAATTEMMADREDHDINRQTLQLRGYDLVIDMIGTNMWNPGEHLRQLGDVIAAHRAALPGVGYLLMTPPDYTGTYGDTKSLPRIVTVSQDRAKAAEDHQAAFWDFRAAMGGAASANEFANKRLASKDRMHFTSKGGAYMGGRIAYALNVGLNAYLASHPQAGCPVPPAAAR